MGSALAVARCCATSIPSEQELVVGQVAHTSISESPNRFDVVKEPVLNTDELETVLKSFDASNGTVDPSCAVGTFATRTKKIRFVMLINGQVQCLAQNFFIQHADYNDFSGGYRREYDMIDSNLIQTTLSHLVKRFSEHYAIPEKTVMLMQIQTSFLESGKRWDRRSSITGQGIHTDGAERAMLVCLHRGVGIDGAFNQFHAETDGSAPLCDSFPLTDGQAVFFKDNELFHYVTPGKGTEGMDNSRTMLLMHSPVEEQLQGLANVRNFLRSTVSNVQLRNLEIPDQMVDALDHA